MEKVDLLSNENNKIINSIRATANNFEKILENVNYEFNKFFEILDNQMVEDLKLYEQQSSEINEKIPFLSEEEERINNSIHEISNKYELLNLNLDKERKINIHSKEILNSLENDINNMTVINEKESLIELDLKKFNEEDLNFKEKIFEKLKLDLSVYKNISFLSFIKQSDKDIRIFVNNISKYNKKEKLIIDLEVTNVFKVKSIYPSCENFNNHCSLLENCNDFTVYLVQIIIEALKAFN